jgi:S1-C subfamily serine protease
MRLCLIGLLSLSLAAVTLPAQNSKETFYTQAERMVIHLERALPTGGYSPVGTGFFVRNEQNEGFVVTARHVASLGVDLRARVPTYITASGKTDVVELRLPSSRWVYHENGGNEQTLPVDVAVMKIPGAKERSLVFFRYCAKNCPKDEYNQLAEDPLPPDQVIIFGFPVDLGFTLKEQRPMTRVGVVSLTSDNPFITEDGTHKLFPKGVFLVDARMFPGNSGGPVIVYNLFKQIRLGGLVTATNRNLDFGIVTPVSQIVETLERAKDASAEFEAWFPLGAAGVN